MVKLHLIWKFAVLASCAAFGQDIAPTTHLPNQEIRISNLSLNPATSKSYSAVLAADLEAVFHDKDVCCGKNSTLEDVVGYAALRDHTPLKELAGKLQGRHLLSDGRPILVTAEYTPHSSITPYQIVSLLREQRPQIVSWQSHLYVLYGALFDDTCSNDGGCSYAIHKLFLRDARFSDSRREVVFDREADDWDKFGGMLSLSVAPQ